MSADEILSIVRITLLWPNFYGIRIENMKNWKNMPIEPSSNSAKINF